MTLEMELAAKKASFGSLTENSSGTDIVIATPGTFVKWPGSTVGNETGLNYVVGSAANDNMTIGKNGAGNYVGKYNAAIKLEHNQCVQAALFKNNVIIPQSESRLTTPSPPKVFADSINLITGSLESGDVSVTRNLDGIPYSIREVGGAPGLKYEITYIDKTKSADIFEAIMKYIGISSHLIKARAFDRNLATFIDLSSSATDFPASLWYYRVMLKVPGDISDYYNAAGEIIIQVDHTSPGNTGHLLNLDETAMVADQPFVIMSGGFNESLAIDDVIDLRFTCPMNEKTIATHVVNVNISRQDNT